VRSDWFGVLLYWRARTSHNTEADCDRNACANSDPVPNRRAAPDSAALSWIGFSYLSAVAENDVKGIAKAQVCQAAEPHCFANALAREDFRS
jgi:hypothetical protein